ncbi:MAG: hypothetical protein FJ138_15545 [Deltaproteobacteria bacterium]|nr:hypothetical protein [Deltaproteobacteria bacterium]
MIHLRAATGQRRLGAGRRVKRGGSWNNDADNCRVAYRNRNTPDNRNQNLGLRLSSSPRLPARRRVARQGAAPVPRA